MIVKQGFKVCEILLQNSNIKASSRLAVINFKNSSLF